MPGLDPTQQGAVLSLSHIAVDGSEAPSMRPTATQGSRLDAAAQGGTSSERSVPQWGLAGCTKMYLAGSAFQPQSSVGWFTQMKSHSTVTLLQRP